MVIHQAGDDAAGHNQLSAQTRVREHGTAGERDRGTLRRAPCFGMSVFGLLRGGAGGVRTHDLTDYESAALTS